MKMTHPPFLSAPLGKLLLNAKALCQFGGHLIDGFALEAWLDGPIGEYHVGHIAAGGIQRKIHLLRGGAIRQQNVGIFCRGGHVAVDHHNHLSSCRISWVRLISEC